MSKPTVFISYSHKDEAWKERIVTHLKAFVHQGDIVLWDDRKIDTGEDWFPEIEAAMKEAAIAVCIISAHYLASDFINKEEIPALKRRRQQEGMLLMPILISPCPWEAMDWLKGIQMFPKDGISLDEISPKVKQEKKLSEFALEIHENITAEKVEQPATPVTSPAPYKIDIERLPKTGEEVFGRAKELSMLDDAWESPDTHIISFVAWGGVGKSALINKWVHQMRDDNYRAAQRIYAWSFYSQGTGRSVTSADMFVNKALHWFGDSEMADSKRLPWDKGKRLAELVRQKKTLLILDGLEPLQSDYDHDKGEVKDPALAVLLRELAKENSGLCVITTRETLTGIRKGKESIFQKNLEQISPEAGRALLRVNGIRGTDSELEQLTRDFGCHALAVNLLVAYLQNTTDRHIRNAALIPDLDIPEEDGKHPRRVIQALADCFGPSPELNVLHIMGLFDRPARAKEINWLRRCEEVSELTDRIRWLTEDDWNRVINNLRHFNLIAPESHHNMGGLDAHPHVREHFGQQLRQTNEESFKQGHSHLYEFLKMSAPRLPDTLEEMEPLFAAVMHGCLAGKHQEALDDVYSKRIRRRREAYIVLKLGAFGAALSCLSNFFEKPWKRTTSDLTDDFKALTLGWTGFALRGVGRLSEAAQPTKAGLEMLVEQKNWQGSARSANNLSELYLTLGEVVSAQECGAQSVTFADRSGDGFLMASKRANHADALHQAGRKEAAERLFIEAENIQKERRPQNPWLYSLPGFEFCDLLLSVGKYQEVLERGRRTVKLESRGYPLLSIALDKLTIGKALMFQSVDNDSSGFTEAEDYLNQAVDGLQEAGTQQYLPLGLFARATLFRHKADFLKSWGDLDEAQEIAEYGQMRLYLTDYHLEACRNIKAQLAVGGDSLSGFEVIEDGQTLSLTKEQMQARFQEHFNEAERLVKETGYHRRDAEVEELRGSG